MLLSVANDTIDVLQRDVLDSHEAIQLYQVCHAYVRVRVSSVSLRCCSWRLVLQMGATSASLRARTHARNAACHWHQRVAAWQATAARWHSSAFVVVALLMRA